MRIRNSYVLATLGLGTSLTIVGVILVNYCSQRYNGRTLNEWFKSPRGGESIAAFQKAGTNSFQFLVDRMKSGGRFAACTIVASAFSGEQIENSDIETELRSMLKSGGQGDQLAAYAVIRKIGLVLPDSEIMAAAETCPSIKSSEEQLNRAPKLYRLREMTNSIDCGFVVQLCQDLDPQVQMSTIDFLEKIENSSNGMGCEEEVVRAMQFVLEKTTDSSVLRATLAYLAQRPDRIRMNVVAICKLLEKSSDLGLQSECASLLEVLAKKQPLTAEAKQTLELLLSRPDIDQDMKRRAGSLLAEGPFLHKN